MNELNHLAIIMDGNGRWAKKRGFLRTNGHEAGANVVSDMCEFCIDNGVKILSLYTFSTENWKRPQKEVDFLMNLLKKFLLLKCDDFIKNGIKFNTIGDISPFSDELKSEIEITKNATRENTNLLLNLAINYGSKDEIVRAVNALLAEKGTGDTVTEEDISRHLYTGDENGNVPDPDLIIRTSGEERVSNFLLWQCAYSEFAFTDSLWPDFRPDEFEAIIKDFSGRERRFGGRR